MCGKYKLKKGAKPRKKVEQIIGGLHAQKRNFQAGRPNPIFQCAEEKATAGHLLIAVGRGLHPAVGERFAPRNAMMRNPYLWYSST